MPQDIDNIVEYYENLDTTDFPIVEPAVLKKLRQRKAEFLESQKLVFGFEKEVATWLSQQDNDTKEVINGVLKNIMQAKGMVAHS